MNRPDLFHVKEIFTMKEKCISMGNISNLTKCHIMHDSGTSMSFWMLFKKYITT